jgi:hypothetical protein
MIGFDEVKKELRITTDVFDNEIQRLIDEAVEDLARSGITLTSSKMFGRAVVCYARTYFGERDEKDRDLMRLGYETVKARLAVTDGD